MNQSLQSIQPRPLSYKIISLITGLYAGLGAGISISLIPDDVAGVIGGLMVYTLVPFYSAFAVWRLKMSGFVVGALLFAFQVVRPINIATEDSVSWLQWFSIPDIAPIGVVVSFGDYANNKGYLFDVFALLMTICMAYFCFYHQRNLSHS